jgi:hypothetical protein
MQTLTSFYFSFSGWVPFAPILIVGVAILVTLRMSKHKWIVHALTFAALFLTLPVYIWIGGVLDPTSIENPGPGDGFVVLLYFLALVPMAIGYAIYAWLTRRPSRAAASLT